MCETRDVSNAMEAGELFLCITLSQDTNVSFGVFNVYTMYIHFGLGGV